ncbi:hypothetical protein ACWDYJ_18660 [Streptomyces sp. NPDC003042]
MNKQLAAAAVCLVAGLGALSAAVPAHAAALAGTSAGVVTKPSDVKDDLQKLLDDLKQETESENDKLA